jgi:hypothetical protein
LIALTIAAHRAAAAPPPEPLCDWEVVIAPVGTRLHSVDFGAKLFVAVAEDGSLLSSPDGAIWTARESGTARPVLTVRYLNDRFLAGGQGILLSSASGINWAAHFVPPGATIHDSTFARDTFVAVGELVGQDGAPPTSKGLILTSTDGLGWTARASAGATTLTGVTFGQGVFVAVGADVAGAVVLISPDGVAWTKASSLTELGESEPALRKLAFGDGLFIGVGLAGGSCSGSGHGLIARSLDARTWEVVGSHDCSVENVVHAEDRFFAVSNYGARGGVYGMVLSSSDGRDWRRFTVLRDRHFYGLAWGSDRLLAVGDSGAVLRSGDVSAPTGPPRFKYGLFLRDADGAFRALVEGKLGAELVLEASTDLKDWTAVQLLRVSECVTEVTDSQAGRWPHRFYRMREVLPPP